MSVMKAKVDSAEGIVYLMRWARAHRYVLQPYHEEIANKYGVSTEGVVISRPLPITSKQETDNG